RWCSPATGSRAALPGRTGSAAHPRNGRAPPEGGGRRETRRSPRGVGGCSGCRTHRRGREGKRRVPRPVRGNGAARRPAAPPARSTPSSGAVPAPSPDRCGPPTPAPRPSHRGTRGSPSATPESGTRRNRPSTGSRPPRPDTGRRSRRPPARRPAPRTRARGGGRRARRRPGDAFARRQVKHFSDHAVTAGPVRRPDRLLVDLPVGGLGQVVDEVHRLRLLVAGQVLGGEGDHVTLGQAGAVGHH